MLTAFDVVASGTGAIPTRPTGVFGDSFVGEEDGGGDWDYDELAEQYGGGGDWDEDGGGEWDDEEDDGGGGWEKKVRVAAQGRHKVADTEEAGS
mgnify:CR=1 FL=1